MPKQLQLEPHGGFYPSSFPRVGDVVRLKEAILPYTPPSKSLGIIIEHMPPFAKSMEPYGLFRIMWSGDLEYLNRSDSLSDDSWFSPDDLEVVCQKHTDDH